jgi:hypothetical protein
MSGDPLVSGLDFGRAGVTIVRKCAPGVSSKVQTNDAMAPQL